jgi:hypothetical protein
MSVFDRSSSLIVCAVNASIISGAGGGGRIALFGYVGTSTISTLNVSVVGCVVGGIV